MTTKHLTFDETVFRLSKDISDDEEMISYVHELETIDESNENIRWESENARI